MITSKVESMPWKGIIYIKGHTLLFSNKVLLMRILSLKIFLAWKTTKPRHRSVIKPWLYNFLCKTKSSNNPNWVPERTEGSQSFQKSYKNRMWFHIIDYFDVLKISSSGGKIKAVLTSYITRRNKTFEQSL